MSWIRPDTVPRYSDSRRSRHAHENRFSTLRPDDADRARDPTTFRPSNPRRLGECALGHRSTPATRPAAFPHPANRLRAGSRGHPAGGLRAGPRGRASRRDQHTRPIPVACRDQRHDRSRTDAPAPGTPDGHTRRSGRTIRALCGGRRRCPGTIGPDRRRGERTAAEVRPSLRAAHPPRPAVQGGRARDAHQRPNGQNLCRANPAIPAGRAQRTPVAGSRSPPAPDAHIQPYSTLPHSHAPGSEPGRIGTHPAADTPQKPGEAPPAAPAAP